MTSLQLPGFIIGGAPRSGTTWLYQALDRHPQIFMAKPVKPEPKFFLMDDLYEKGLEFYSKNWFSGATSGQVCGEKSTNYLESPIAAQRIKGCLPQVKLIFILRNPVDRAFSNYLWSRMNGMEKEDFATALSLEDERERSLPQNLKYARPHAYFSRGIYSRMLRPYFDLFSRNQILCVREDDLEQKSESLLVRVHEFVGVAPRSEDASGLGVVNPSRSEGIQLSDDVRSLLSEKYRHFNQELLTLLGSEFKGWS
jgi:hypothetical protein